MKIFKEKIKSILDDKITMKNHLPVIDNQYYYEASALNHLIETKEVTNIGLIGGLGSGKSSIIKTLFNQYPKRFIKSKTIQISLGKFNKDDDEQSPERDNDIEKSILQQLLFRTKSTLLYRSSIRRVPNIHVKNKWIYFLTILLIFVGLIIHLGVDYWTTIEFLYQIEKMIIMTSHIVIFTMTIIFTCKFLLDLLRGILIRNIKYKDFELIINESKESSPVDLFANELIYFFSKTKYSIIVIEDLDRFSTIYNVLKSLRELNHLLNQNPTIKRKITFIYSISDQSLDSPENKTKFFDGIVTVFPFMNTLSILDHLEKIGIKNEQLKRDISPYLMNKRLLNSIENDFNYFINRFSDSSVKQDDLFVIAVYKNLLYEDFYDFIMGKGLLNEMLKNRQKYMDEHINKLNDLINIENQNINQFKNELLYNTSELITLVEKEIKKKKSYYGVELNPDFFDNMSINQQFNLVANRTQATMSYNDINGFSEYVNRYNALKKTKQENIENSENLKVRYINEISKLSYTPLSEMLMSYGLLKVKSDINQLNDKKGDKKLNNEQVDFILMVLSKGYISEKIYITLSNKFSDYMTESDLYFIRDITIMKKPKLDYKLDNPHKVILHLDEFYFNLPFTLNFDIFDFLITNMSQYKVIWDKYSAQFETMTTEIEAFLISYDIEKRNKFEFLKFIMSKNKNFVKLVAKSTMSNKQYLMNIIKSVSNPIIMEHDNNILRKMINEIDDYIDFSKELDHNKFIELMISLNAKINKVTHNSSAFYESIINENLFELNIYNVNEYIKFKFPQYSDEEIVNNGYGILLQNSAIVKLFYGILKDYKDQFYYDIVFNYHKPSVDDDDYLEIINDASLKSETKKDFINRVSTSLNSVAKVLDKNLLNDLVQHDRIAYNVMNIYSVYLEKNSNKKYISDYITRHKHEQIDTSEELISNVSSTTEYKGFIYDAINYSWFVNEVILLLIGMNNTIDLMKITNENFLDYYMDFYDGVFDIKLLNYLNANKFIKPHLKYMVKYQNNVMQNVSILEITNTGKSIIGARLIDDELKMTIIQKLYDQYDYSNQCDILVDYLINKWNHSEKIPVIVIEKIITSFFHDAIIVIEKQFENGNILNTEMDTILKTIGFPFDELSSGNEVLIENNKNNKSFLSLLSSMKYAKRKYKIGLNRFAVQKL